MKRTAMIAIVIAALTFGVVGFAIATQQNVVVSATVNPAFEFTLQGPGALALVADPLIDPLDTATSALRVRSNVPWTFTAAPAAYSAVDFGPFMSDTVSETNGNKARGVTNITTSYTLDLSDDSAFNLAPGAYSASYLYTAVQQ